MNQVTVQAYGALSCLYQNIQQRVNNEPQLRSGSDATPMKTLMAKISTRSWEGCQILCWTFTVDITCVYMQNAWISTISDATQTWHGYTLRCA
jgi:hypothetical protein